LFVSGQPASSNDEENPDWLPTLHIGWASSPQNENSKKNGTQSTRRSSKHQPAESAPSSSAEPNTDADQQSEGSTSDAVVSLKGFAALQEELTALRQENEDLKKTNAKLRNRLRKIGDIARSENE